MLQPHPCQQHDAEGEVEESLIADRQNYEDRRESEEEDEQAVQVVVVWL